MCWQLRLAYAESLGGGIERLTHLKWDAVAERGVVCKNSIGAGIFALTTLTARHQGDK